MEECYSEGQEIKQQSNTCTLYTKTYWGISKSTEVWTICTEIVLLLWWFVQSSVHFIDCSDACIPSSFLCFFAALQWEHSKGDEFDVINLVFV